MRIDGTLKTWHDDRGFGFIAPAQGGQEIFVHVSAFPRDGKRPMPGESLSFEVTLNDEGKKRAVRVERPGQSRASTSRPAPDFFERHARQPLRMSRRPVQRDGWTGKVVTLIIVVALGAYGYKHYEAEQRALPQSAAALPQQDASTPAIAPVSLICDGRQHCSQMTSCSEAKYFLRHCPDTKMDGDRDGVPCEEQWCKTPWSK